MHSNSYRITPDERKRKKQEHREHASYAERHASMPTNGGFFLSKSTNWKKTPQLGEETEGEEIEEEKKKKERSLVKNHRLSAAA